MTANRFRLEWTLAAVAFALGVSPVVSIAAASILLGLAIAVGLVARVRWRVPPIWLPLVLFMLGTVISLLLCADPGGGFAQIKKFYVLLTVPMMYTALRGRRLATRLLAAWGAAAVAASLVSFVQFILKVLAAEKAGSPIYNYYVVQRTTGFMSHWMTFGGLQMMVLMLLLAFVLWPTVAGKWRWVAAGAAAVVGVSIVVGLTRGVWMGCGVGVVYLVWCWNRKWLLAIPVLLAILVFASTGVVRERVRSFVQPQGDLDSNRFRIVTARTGLEMVKAHPFFGVGPMRVGPEFEKYLPEDVQRPLPPGYYQHLHNIYLQYAAERGIPTMLCMMWMIGWVLWDFRRGLRGAAGASAGSRWVLHGAIAAILAVLTEGFVEYNLGDSEVLFLFLTIVCCGYLAIEDAAPPAETVGVAVRTGGEPPVNRTGRELPLDGGGELA